MKPTRFALLVLVLSAAPVFAQIDPVSRFAARSHSYQGQTLLYRIFIPEGYQSSTHYPLLLALHGSGERGSNNLSQLTANKMATAWVDPPVQAKSPCFVIAPQCPLNFSWGDEIGALNDLLDSLSREFSLDSNRIYITGLSMGGYGTWNMITVYPQRFAAAVPMSGGWDSSQAYIVRDMPIWDFHGAVDPTVPVTESRKMVSTLENFGRSAVYTDCHAFDCTGMPDSLVAMYVRSHSDLFYTEYQGGGHVIWDQAYTTPLLSTWLFDQYRQIPAAIRLNNLAPYVSLSGVTDIRWTGGTAEDSVEIWVSPDAGGHWQLVMGSAPNTGAFTWNTALVSDCAVAQLKIFLKNREGRIYGRDRSPFFTINNPGNGSPFVKVETPGIEPGQTLTGDSLALRILVNDPEGSMLTVRILYSTDAGDTYVVADSFAAPSDTLTVTRMLNIGRLANADNGKIAVEADDGSLAGRAALAAFSKQTPRSQGPPVERTSGGGGSVAVHVVDPFQLTGHLYRVTFRGTVFGEKSYDVTDLDRGVTVLQGGSPLDGRTEGPMFDGVRLVVRDELQAALDAAGTKWEIAAPTILDVAARIPTIILETGTIYGYPEAADYGVNFTDHVVDTSSSAVAGAPELPVTFSVMNFTANRRCKFIYVDADNNGALSGNDEVYFLEPDSLSNLRVTWELQFLSGTGKTLPQPGDKFVLKTIKPISTGDVFEFRTVSTSVQEDTRPERTMLFANYPNPFNPTTKLRYSVGGVVAPSGASPRGVEGPAVNRVRLVIYDLLGRKVATLVDEVKAPGSYEVSFDGSHLASGVYFYRLTTGSISLTNKMILLK